MERAVPWITISFDLGFGSCRFDLSVFVARRSSEMGFQESGEHVVWHQLLRQRHLIFSGICRNLQRILPQNLIRIGELV